MEFGLRLNELLQEREMSQSRLAEATGLHKGLLSRVINGEKPSSKFLYTIIEYFEDVNPSYFFTTSEKDYANEGNPGNGKQQDPMSIIQDIEAKLRQLKKLVSQ